MSQSHRPEKGFTLVELLVVIGIIALLISILLPSLNSARRSANAVKCLSNMKQIHGGFMMYANDFKQTFPVAVHATSQLRIPIGANERRWYDLVAKYIVGKNVESTALFQTASGGTQAQQQAAQVSAIRANSVLWGCPEWSRIDGNVDALDDLRPGYGMNLYTKKFFQSTSLATALVQETANLVRDATGLDRGTYLKTSQWGGRSSSENGLLFDSMTHIVQVPGAAQMINCRWAGTGFVDTGTTLGYWQPSVPTSPYINAGTAFYVDGARHTRKSRPQTQQRNFRETSLNGTFVDGSARTMNVQEAWTSIVGRTP